MQASEKTETREQKTKHESNKMTKLNFLSQLTFGLSTFAQSKHNKKKYPRRCLQNCCLVVVVVVVVLCLKNWTMLAIVVVLFCDDT